MYREENMARASAELIIALRNTVSALKNSTDYQWGHMGSCNCGFLAREITKLRKDEIHSSAMLGHGDWSEQLNDYCPTSGMPMDNVISQMLASGLDTDDLKHLERLASPVVLRSLPLAQRDLRHNVKTDVITYLEAWIKLLVDDLNVPEILEASFQTTDDLMAAEKMHSLLVGYPG